MKLRRGLWVLIILLSFWQGAKAQQVHLSTNNTFSPSYNLGSVTGLTLSIKNIGATSISDTLSLQYSINSTLHTQSSDSATGGLVYQFNPPDTLTPGDSVNTSIVVAVKPGQFSAGPSVIVIWPISTGLLITDSLKIQFQVIDPNGIAGEDEAQPLLVYYLNETIYFNNADQIAPYHVRIYNEMGSMVFAAQGIDNGMVKLPANLSAGVYVAEMMFGNMRRTFRFIK